jgi:hypothetical protein
MRYQILGGEPLSTEDKLAQYKGEVGWSYLRPHYEHGTLYYVDPELPLETVGAAFSENRTADVAAWLKSGDLVKIEALHVFQWEDSDTQFEALVVSPFVLCRTV